MDERREIRGILGKLEFSSGRSLAKFLLCVLAAASTYGLLGTAELSEAGRRMSFILVLAAGLWVTEAIPAFAVGLLIISLEIGLLGRPDGVFAKSAKDWEIFVHPWASPLIWLFFGGFVLAEAASKTGLDSWLSRSLLGWFGTRPSRVLLGVMAITFCFSMFVSNTATTAMMIAVIAPVVASLKDRDPFAKALLLGVPFAANLGGMATLIGSPPNAIAAGVLSSDRSIAFFD